MVVVGEGVSVFLFEILENKIQMIFVLLTSACDGSFDLWL